jgi:hypothetical protein
MRGDWRDGFGAVAASIIQVALIVAMLFWYRDNEWAVSRALRWIDDDIFAILAVVGAAAILALHALSWWALAIWITAWIGGEDRRHEIRDLFIRR